MHRGWNAEFKTVHCRVAIQVKLNAESFKATQQMLIFPKLICIRTQPGYVLLFDHCFILCYQFFALLSIPVKRKLSEKRTGMHNFCNTYCLSVMTSLTKAVSRCSMATIIEKKSAYESNFCDSFLSAANSIGGSSLNMLRLSVAIHN